MNLNEAKRILNKNGYFLKEDARRNNTDISDIFSLIDVHDWSPKWITEQIMKHYYEPITVDYIDKTNYKDYIGKYVNVKEYVDLSVLNLQKLPIRFGTVGDFFNCDYNMLTSLEGAPKEVGGYFNCVDNKLTSLEGAPKVVGGNFECRLNYLTTLKGIPKEIGGDFDCSKNKLTSLDGAPKVVGGDFYCADNEVEFTEDDVLKVSNVNGRIAV